MPQPMSSPAELAKELDELNKAIAACPLDETRILQRVFDIMQGASASDESKASFGIGQIYEALLPMRIHRNLLAKRARVNRALNAAVAATDSEEDSSDSQS